MMLKKIYVIFNFLIVSLVYASTKSKPHGHTGVLEAYDGKLIPFKVTGDQEKKLAKGESVTYASIFLYFLIYLVR